MKKKSIHPSSLSLALSLLVAVAADAAPITWSSAPFTVSGSFGATLNTGQFATTGIQILAENSGGDALTFDGINFTAGTYTAGASGSGFHDTLPFANTLLARDGTSGTNGVASAINLIDLTPGNTYRVQALVYDGRGITGIPGRTVSFDGINQGVYANGVFGSTWGDGLLVTGTFIADASTQNFTIEAFEGVNSIGGQLNALLVHEFLPETPSLSTPVVSNISTTGADVATSLLQVGANVTLYWATTDQDLGPWDNSNSLGAQVIGPVSGPITGLTRDTQYFYRFQAVNTGADPDTEAWSTADTSFATSLAGMAPTDPAATTVSATQIDVTWNEDFNTETGFVIERSPNGIDTWTQAGTTGPNTGLFSDIDRLPSTTYHYRVSALNGAGPSDLSSVVSATTTAPTTSIAVQAWFRMGDDGQGISNRPVDSSGNGRDFTNNINTATITPTGGGYDGGAFYTFNGTNQGFYDVGYDAPENNVGIEVWARTSNLVQTDRHLFGTGTNQNGLNIGYDANGGRGWFGAIGGVAFVGSVGAGNYTAGEWIHLAVVRDNGVSTFYINGVASTTTGATPNNATEPHIAVKAGAPPNGYFGGDLAEARIFTFTPGNFDPNELLSTPVLPQLVYEQAFPTTSGKAYLVRFQIEPNTGETTVPRLRLGITGNTSLGNHTLQTALPSSAVGVPYFFRFIADSASTTLRFSTLDGDVATASQIAGLTVAEPISATPSTVPNARQQAQIDRRYGLFLHYGINTFHNLEWTDGSFPASSYQPTDLDVEQWVQTAYEAGMRYVLLISKHHDGFCVWDSPWTDYDVGSSSVPTDIIAAAAAACQKYGIKLAIYYSIWDRREPTYSNDEAYKQYMLRQLTELLGNYGPVCELWLDGGWEKANHRWPSEEIYDLVRRLQPDCQVSTNWTIGHPSNPDQHLVLPVDQQEGYPFRYFPSDFRLGDPYLPKFPDPKVFSHNGDSYYLPFEATVTLSSQNRWFFNTTDLTNKSVSQLAEMFYTTTAQNNILVLNAPPDRSGKIRDIERNTLFQLRDKLGLSAGVPLPQNVTGTATGTASAVFQNDIASYGPQLALDGNAASRWASGPDGITSASLEVDFGAVRTFDRILIDEFEPSAGVGRITSFRLQAWDGSGWTTFHTGTTCRRFSLHKFPAQSTSKVRLLIDTATGAPSIWEFQIHKTDDAFTSWRDQEFSPDGNSDPSYAWDGDPDKDGIINLFEFALNDDPLNPAPSGKTAMLASQDPGLDGFVFTLPVRDGAVFTGMAPPTAEVDGINYQIQGSLDLGSFGASLTEVSPAHSAGLPPLNAGWSYRSFRHTTPEIPAGFFRLRLGTEIE